MPLSDAAVLDELIPTVDRLLERHLSATKEWMPHELVPWSRGRDFVPGEEWDESEFPLPPAVRSALFVNLLTEDNLPHYFETINRVFGLEAWRGGGRPRAAGGKRPPHLTPPPPPPTPAPPP